MQELRIILWVFMGIGMLIAFCGFVSRRKRHARLDRERARTEGVVVDHVKNPGGGPFLPVIAYTVDGEERVATWKSTVRADRLEIGQSVDVFYDPDHPEHFHLIAEEEIDPSAEVLRIGIIIVACALCVSLYANVAVGRSPLAWARRSGRSGQTAVESAGKFRPDYRFRNDSDATCSLIAYTGNKESVFVPVFMDQRIVTRIGLAAFAERESLRKVEIPGTIREVSASAFRGCSNLEAVHMRDGVEMISKGAFSECPGLRDVTLPKSLTNISDKAFDADCAATFHVEEGSYAADWCRAQGYAVDAAEAD